MKLVPIETLIEKSREYVLSTKPKDFPWYIIEGKDFDNAIAIARKWKNQGVFDKLKVQKEKYADTQTPYRSPRSWVNSWAIDLKYRKRWDNKHKINDDLEKVFPREELNYFDSFRVEILSAYEAYVNAKITFLRQEYRLKEVENLISNGHIGETQKSLDFIEQTIDKLLEEQESPYIPPAAIPSLKEEANV